MYNQGERGKNNMAKGIVDNGHGSTPSTQLIVALLPMPNGRSHDTVDHVEAIAPRTNAKNTVEPTILVQDMAFLNDGTRGKGAITLRRAFGYDM